MSDKGRGRGPALFDDGAFAEDLRRASDAGREVAVGARKEFEKEGVPVGSLLACDEEGPDGTQLRHCVKLRLPPPNGKFGMVFRIEQQKGRSVLVFAAFGARHHPANSNAFTVYEIAHRRLHAS
ncbi:MAG TPA: hypothetical protein VFN89_06620 [Solirubrobacterales bacterium]|nr:hypothetical protein [Solirubrobacterales bacterium]